MIHRALPTKIASLASGGALAMIINALAYPLLAHFYSPAAYGNYGIFLFFASIFSAVSTFKFDLIIPLQKEGRDLSSSIMASCYSIILVIPPTILASLIYYYNDPNANILLTVISVILYGAFQTSGAVLICIQKNLAAGFIIVVQALTAVCVQIALSGQSIGWYGLAIGYISSLLAAITVGIVLILRYGEGAISLRFLRIGGYIAILRAQRNRWQANMLQALVNAISLNFLAYACLQTGGREAVGLFSFCQRIMTIPVRVIGSAVRQVLLREYSLIPIDSHAMTSMMRLIWVLLAGSIVVFSALSLSLPFLIDWLLPNEWGGLADFVYPIAIWLVFTIAYVPAISMLNALGNNWLHTSYEVANLVQRALILIAVIPLGIGPVMYLYATSFVSVILIILFVCAVYLYSSRLIKIPESFND